MCGVCVCVCVCGTHVRVEEAPPSPHPADLSLVAMPVMLRLEGDIVCVSLGYMRELAKT